MLCFWVVGRLDARGNGSAISRCKVSIDHDKCKLNARGQMLRKMNNWGVLMSLEASSVNPF